ncbi:hypothetical protein J6590_042281 [Homalodisca vitripennis]|nr:hypothetical protein J6590_042281 [Homalodisca vitripennis]
MRSQEVDQTVPRCAKKYSTKMMREGGCDCMTVWTDLAHVLEYEDSATLHPRTVIILPTDPWRAVSPPPPAVRQPLNDPWSPATEPSPAHSASPAPSLPAATPLSDLDEFDQILNRERAVSDSNSVNNNPTGESWHDVQ